MKPEVERFALSLFTEEEQEEIKAKVNNILADSPKVEVETCLAVKQVLGV